VLESGDWSLIASDTLACPLACKKVVSKDEVMEYFNEIQNKN